VSDTEDVIEHCEVIVDYRDDSVDIPNEEALPIIVGGPVAGAE
jgi:hypothetical protein